jgi:hypothetical protein
MDGQREWFFVPARIDPPVALALRDEPLSRGRGNAHVMQFAHRREARPWHERSPSPPGTACS